MSPRTFPFATALAAGLVLVVWRPEDSGQSGALRTSERWLDSGDFSPVVDGSLVSQVIEAPHAFESLGLGWRASRAAELSHRVSADGQRWGEWLPVGEDHHGAAGGGKRVGELQFYAEPVRFVQLRVDGGAVSVDQLHAVFIQPGEVVVAPAPAPVVASSAENPVPKPGVVSRTAWGCPDGQGSRWAPVATDPDFLIVHHSAGSNSSNNWAATVQAIWSFHALSRGWGDVGYNFLIDPNGVIYEGRAGEDSIGAHFSCTNGGTMGVCMIGDYTSIEPTEAALDSLAHLLAWKADLEDIDPLAQEFHPQSRLTLDTISGHRDGNPGTQGCASGTVCPGAMLYPMLPDVRSRVAEIIAVGTPFPPEIGLGGLELVGEVSRGQALELQITLQHLDGAPATGIAATLSTTSPHLTITDGLNPYPDLADGEVDDEIGDFDLTINADAPHGHAAVLTLAVAADNGEWSFQINLPPVYVPPQVGLDAATFTPDEVLPGASSTVSYQIVTDRALSAEFALALIGGTGDEYDLSPFTTSLSAGAQTKNRGVIVPAGTPAGTYGLRVEIGESGTPLAADTFPSALTVLSPSFGDWAGATITDPASRGEYADGDADNLPNLLEYALLLDPSTADVPPVEFLWIEDAAERYPAVRFSVRAGMEYEVAVEVDDGSSSWDALAEPYSVEPIIGGERRVVRSAYSTEARAWQLFRVRVSTGE